MRPGLDSANGVLAVAGPERPGCRRSGSSLGGVLGFAARRQARQGRRRRRMVVVVVVVVVVTRLVVVAVCGRHGLGLEHDGALGLVDQTQLPQPEVDGV